MPFPTNSPLQLSPVGDLPQISFSIVGNKIDPTSYVVGVSESKVAPGQETTVKYIPLIKSADLDTAKQIKGSTVQQVSDLDGRALKWIIGLTCFDQLDANFRMQVRCGQDPMDRLVDEPGTLDQGTEVAHGYIFVSVG
jgi:hypothetical protein